MSNETILSQNYASQAGVITPITSETTTTEGNYAAEIPEALLTLPNQLQEDIPTGENNSIDEAVDCQLVGNPKEELIKHLEVSEQDILEEHSELIESITDLPNTLEPTLITFDNLYHNKEFGCLPSTAYPYKDAFGMVVGYIVRWDVKTASGSTKKEPRPYIYDFDTKKWKSKFFGGATPNSRPLYNLPEIIARPDATVMIVEGEKAAEAAKLLFPEFVITTSSGGAKAPNKTDWQHLRNKDIILCPDEGEAGKSYLTNVDKELRKVDAKISRLLEPSKLSPYIVQDGAFIERQSEAPKGYDLADSLAEGWTAEFIEQAQTSKQFQPFFKEVNKQAIIREELKQNEELHELAGQTFKLTPYGLYLQYFVRASAEDLKNQSVDDYSQYDDVLGAAKEAWLPLCGYLKPTHTVRDTTNSWGMLVEFKDMNNTSRATFLKRTDWLGEKGAVEILQDQGLQLRGLEKKKFNLINEYLNEFKPKFNAVGVDMVGWQHDQSTYILPFADDFRNSYTCTREAEQPVTYILQQKGVVSRTLKKKGTLEEWQRTVGSVIKGNHLHTFSVLAALSAPALKLLGEEGGFFHYVGSTSIGKSTILHVAKSVWGYENLGSFRITDNGLEDTCKNTNDGMLFLDEIGEADPEAFFKIVYMLANGVTKTRADRSGSVKATTHFTVLAQSTGEIGLEAKLAEKGKKAKGGQLMRMAELDADRGKGLKTFDVLNINPDTDKLFSSGKEQAEYLKTHARENCGVVIDSFFKKVVPNLDGYVNDLKKAKLGWLERKFTGEEGVEVARMAKRFSSIFASGVIAAGAGILPLTTKDVDACVSAMFNNWLERFGGDSSYEFKSIVEDLRKLVIEQKYARFCNANPTESERENQPKEIAGYWHAEKKEFWIYPSVFKRDVLKGRDEKIFYPLLAKEGYLKKEDAKHYAALRQPAKESRKRFIVVDISVLLPEEN